MPAWRVRIWMLDVVTLAALTREISDRVKGRRIERVRSHGPSCLRLDLSKHEWLALDVGPLPGLWWMSKETRIPNDEREPAGSSKTATLLFRKYLDGARIESVTCSDDRVIVLAARNVRVFLRPHGGAVASLYSDTSHLASFGAQAPCPAGRLEQPVLSRFDRPSLAIASSSPDLATRKAALETICRGLVPLGAIWPENEAAREHAIDVCAGDLLPEPWLALEKGGLRLAPFSFQGASLRASFTDAAELLYAHLKEEALFQERHRALREKARAHCDRLERLRAGLERDRSRWPDPALLRHRAEALLASGLRDAPNAEVTVTDPRGGVSLVVPIPRGVTVPRHADSLFRRARAIEAQIARFDERVTSVQNELLDARSALESALAVTRLEDLPPEEKSKEDPRGTGKKPTWLTTHGLPLWVGRSAKENHDITFHLAKPDDIWLHVQDAPGAHVVLRNLNGRVRDEDIKDAASVAAYFSTVRDDSAVNVQFTARKHVHPARGGRGRVIVSHKEVMRVPPRNPEGWLRRR